MKSYFNCFVTMLILCASFLSTVHAQQKLPVEEASQKVNAGTRVVLTTTESYLQLAGTYVWVPGPDDISLTAGGFTYLASSAVNGGVEFSIDPTTHGTITGWTRNSNADSLSSPVIFRPEATSVGEVKWIWVEDSEVQITNATILFWIVFAIMLLMAAIGTYFGVKNKAVIFIGKKDVIISFIACVLFFICLVVALHPLAGGYRLLAAIVGILLLIFLARTPYLTNQNNVGKTIIVVPTKLIIPSLFMISYVLSFVFAFGAVNSISEARLTPNYSRKQREERQRHQINAIIYGAAAGFFFYASRRLQGLVKKLVKENPSQASAEEIIEAEIVE
jgi:hypothetical protein